VRGGGAGGAAPSAEGETVLRAGTGGGDDVTGAALEAASVLVCLTFPVMLGGWARSFITRTKTENKGKYLTRPRL
jgi:hypothetical protein